MLENVTRTHEYSDLLSTRRSYSRSILSIWVRQRTTRMILFHSRVRRPGAFFKVRHSDFFATRSALPSEEQSRLSKSPLYFISIFSGQRYFGKFLDTSPMENQRTASLQSLHILFYIFTFSTKTKREYYSEYSKYCLRVDIEEKYSRVRMWVLNSSTYFMKLVEYSRE